MINGFCLFANRCTCCFQLIWCQYPVQLLGLHYLIEIIVRFGFGFVLFRLFLLSLLTLLCQHNDLGVFENFKNTETRKEKKVDKWNKNKTFFVFLCPSRRWRESKHTRTHDFQRSTLTNVTARSNEPTVGHANNF